MKKLTHLLAIIGMIAVLGSCQQGVPTDEYNYLKAENSKLSQAIKWYDGVISGFTASASDLVAQRDELKEQIPAVEQEINTLRNEELQCYNSYWRNQSAFNLNTSYSNYKATKTPELIADLKRYSEEEPDQYLVLNHMLYTATESPVYNEDYSKVVLYHDSKFYWGDELDPNDTDDWSNLSVTELTSDELNDNSEIIARAYVNGYAWDSVLINKAKEDISLLESKEEEIAVKNTALGLVNNQVEILEKAVATLKTSTVKQAFYDMYADQIKFWEKLAESSTDSVTHKSCQNNAETYKVLFNNAWGDIELDSLPVSIEVAKTLEPEYVVMYPRGSTFYSYGYRKEVNKAGEVYYYVYKGFHYIGLWQLSCVQKVIKSHDFSALLDHNNPNFIGTPLDFTRYVWVATTGSIDSDDFTKSDWSFDNNRAKSGTYTNVSTYINRANDSFINQAGFYNVVLYAPEGDYPTIFDNVCYNCDWYDCWSTKETQAAGEESYNNWSVKGTAVSNYVYSNVTSIYNTGTPNYNYTLYTQNKAQKWSDLKAMLPAGPGDFKETTLASEFFSLGTVASLDAQANFMPDSSRSNYKATLDWTNKTMEVYGSSQQYSAEDWETTLTTPVWQNKCDYAKWVISLDSSFSPSEGTVILVGHYTECSGYQYVYGGTYGYSGNCRQQVGDYVRILIHKDADGNWYMAFGAHDLARSYAPTYYSCFTNVWQNITGQGQNTSNGSLDSLVGIIGENLDTYLNPAKAPHLAIAYKMDQLDEVANAKVCKLTTEQASVMNKLGWQLPTYSTSFQFKDTVDGTKTMTVQFNFNKNRLVSSSLSQLSWADSTFKSSYNGQWLTDTTYPTTCEVVDDGFILKTTGYFRDWNGPSGNSERRFYHTLAIKINTSDADNPTVSFEYVPFGDQNFPAPLPVCENEFIRK